MKRIMLALFLLAAAVPGAGAAALPLQVLCFGSAATIPGATAGNDILYGTPGDDVIYGMAGNDVIYGRGGRDRLCGGDGNDRIYGGPGGDSLDGDWGNDRVYGQGGNDGFVLGGDGNDILSPGPGDLAFTATIEGGAGRDRILIAHPGYNEIFGGPGRDTIDFRDAPHGFNIDLRYTAEYGDNSGVPSIGGKAFEVENVFGSGCSDVISGKAGPNRLFGFGGDDTLHGRGGDDYLNGGVGIGDWLEGDAGADTCVDPDGFAVGDECEIWP
jgi:Ca2+-binding RTX toxin-like protein